VLLFAPRGEAARSRFIGEQNIGVIIVASLTNGVIVRAACGCAGGNEIENRATKARRRRLVAATAIGAA
jgi:hypothetical protein